MVSFAGCVASCNLGDPNEVDEPTPIQLMTRLAHDVSILKKDFAELTEFEIEEPLTRPLLSYRYKVTYVSQKPKHKSYHKVESGGCMFTIERFSAGEAGWPGVSVGENISSVHWRPLRDGGTLMASVHSPNESLRAAIIEALSRHFANQKVERD